MNEARPADPDRASDPFAHRDFRLFFAARILAGGGLQILNVAVGWLVWTLTRDPWMLGLVGLVTFLPVVVFALPAGVVADRVDRRRVVAVGWAATAGAVALLAFAVASGAATVTAIFATVVVVGSVRAFANPASQAILPTLVPQRAFTRAIALNSMAWQGSSIAGPGLGGVLVAVDPALAFWAASASFFVGAASIWALAARPAAARRAFALADLTAGIAFIRSQPVILGALSLDLCAVLVGGASALFPIYASDVLHVGAVGLGALRAAPPVGALLAALLMVRWPPRRRVGRSMLGAIAVFGAGTVAFGLSTSMTLSLAALVVVGAADMVNVVIRQSLVQGLTPDAMRGRVAAVNTVFIGASNELGEFQSGVAAALIGPVGAVVFGGCAAMAIAAAWGRLFPALAARDAMFEGDGPAGPHP
jgi:MFS family permease